MTGTDGNDTLTGDNLYQENTTLVSNGMGGTLANGDSYVPVVSHNGDYVLFSSQATNIVPGDIGGASVEALQNLYLKDLQTGTMTQINTTASG